MARLRDVQTAHAELARKNIPGPFLPIVYRKANVDMTATPEQAATQRGGNAGKSVLMRGDAIHACVAKHMLPVARHKWTPSRNRASTGRIVRAARQSASTRC